MSNKIPWPNTRLAQTGLGNPLFVTDPQNNTENILQRSGSQFVKIKKVINNDRIDDTFCFTEPKRHMGVFNGVLTPFITIKEG